VRRIRAVQHGVPMVMALGGGAYTQEENSEAIRDNGISLWLDASFELVLERVGTQTHRPLARDPGRFASLFAERRPAYAKADFRIPIQGNDHRVAVAEILRLKILG
jgi:shikimate kinase